MGTETNQEENMCRSIKPLYNFSPPATDEDMRAAALQFVRKVSGYREPSQANKVAFEQGVDEVSKAVHKLLNSLKTTAPPRSHDHVHSSQA